MVYRLWCSHLALKRGAADWFLSDLEEPDSTIHALCTSHDRFLHARLVCAKRALHDRRRVLADAVSAVLWGRL